MDMLIFKEAEFLGRIALCQKRQREQGGEQFFHWVSSFLSFIGQQEPAKVFINEQQLAIESAGHCVLRDFHALRAL